ncbi:hypothetical protein [Bacteroides fragilis]|uniref:hypothetical protein n=1 Tax=Bacteroides fragilis TaxID=817 RepID=UPI002169B37B|nr:hypothetical protein [Bacteroides fragilis]
MTDKKELRGNLMKEGVIMWAVFTKEGKAALRMDNEVHPENGKIGHGRLLSPDVPILHEIPTPDDADRFLSLSEYGISIRIRMRLRYPGTEDSAVKQSEYEPEMCFPAWIVREKTGRISLFLQEPSTGQCSIPDITGLPGLPDLQPDSVPVKVEMLIRKASPLLEHPEYSEDIKKRADRKNDLMKEGVLVWIMFTAGEKAALYANDRIHFTEDGKYVPGKLLSSDISPFHQIYDWDVQYPWIRSKPEILVRYRIRLRYPESDDTGIVQSEYEPEACFPAWIVPQESGQAGLYLEEPSTGQYFIPDMTGLPGLPELQPDGVPVRVELLIRQSHWIFDMLNPALLGSSSYSERLEALSTKASDDQEVKYL